MAVYRIVGQRPDTEVIGGANTRPVQVVEVLTVEHQIYFEARLPRKLASTANLKGLALATAVMLEGLWDIAGVSGVQWTQEPTPDGQLEDHAIVWVTSDTGESESQLDFNYDQLTTDYVFPRVAALRAALNATEGEG